MKEQPDILKQSGLSITESRKKILKLFLDADGALAHSDIEKFTASAFDRVTVYRTLQTFTESGIIHQIPTTDNSILYALCRQDCKQGHHHDDHVHFVCSNCDRTVCLDDVRVPAVKLPKHFTKEHSAMVVTGTCGECV